MLQVGKKLSLFQQLLVVQALRPDRLESAMEHFAQRALGLKVLTTILHPQPFAGAVAAGPESGHHTRGEQGGGACAADTVPRH